MSIFDIQNLKSEIKDRQQETETRVFVNEKGLQSWMEWERGEIKN